MKTIISTEAYIKIVLHGAKYPSAPVGGFLLGIIRNADNAEIIDVIPNYHSVPLGPILDLGGNIAETVSIDGASSIIGFYFANENLDSATIPSYVNKISKTIQIQSGNCLLLQLRGNRLNSDDQLCLTASQISDGSPVAVTSIDSPQRLNNMKDELLLTNVYRLLIDLEDHMDSMSGDFRNVVVENAIKSIIA